MVYLVTAVILLGIFVAIVKVVSSDRYANMTEEEFEAEAKRSSTMGIVVAGLQKIVDPSHKIEMMQEQEQRIEAESSESGDGPETGQQRPPEA
jgi:hypothetical protein